MHRFISLGNKTYFPIDSSYTSPLLIHNEDSTSKRLWIEMLEKEKLDTNSDGADIHTLFTLVNKVFCIHFECDFDATFASMYIASTDGEAPLKHDDASRAFESGKVVYIDKLMVNALFEYVANYYLWARFGSEVFPFCFSYALNQIDLCCRQGFINSDENISSLLRELKGKCDARAYQFIADMYWSIIAFLMCHELAHIYIDCAYHSKGVSVPDGDEETLADQYGYEVFLRLIEGNLPGLESPFTNVFHDYLYAAPMVLFLFYEDLFFMEYWIYGETVPLGDHARPSDRISKLLDISRQSNFTFDLHSGDDVLNSFWDTSEAFREELFYKLKNGKLTKFIQKGYRNMNNTTGYEEALLFDNTIQSKLRDYAEREHISVDKLLGLYNMAVKYEVPDAPMRGFIHGTDGKLISSKPYNLRFRLTFSLSAIIDTGVTLFSRGEKLLTILQLIKILIVVIGEMDITMSEDQASVLLECFKSHANIIPVDEEKIIEASRASHNTIDELCKLRCIELEDGKIRLLEEISIR